MAASMFDVLRSKKIHQLLATTVRRASVALASLLVSGCTPIGLGFLNPAGPVAASQRDLFVNVILLMLVVIIPVFILMPLIAWRYRYKNRSALYRPNWTFSWPLEILIWGVPVVIVATLSVFVWRATHHLDPYRAIASNKPALEIQVVGLDWKWLFIYPDQRIATVNELVFPVDQSIRLLITSDTVLQSLMIPRLGGQIYAMAGMRTELNLKSDAPGIFTGENTQYNGKGFQDQKFKAVAVSPDEFSAWISRVQALPTRLDVARYAELSQKSVTPTPLFFSKVEPGLFDKVIARYHHGGTAMQAMTAND
ncbi:COX aromatic rich motif-containing protein [Polaromonas sp. CG_9.11]|uniref:COX aromatic rich motif-containing protein n=1 Tax=Polaromonas sp. CG_9.11 TaxID=2787730 RepID=UPI0018C92DE8|nr:cytochrome o ubiquinol oxidase subunit 2 [Polaromonas sp. CG_9.11]